MKNNQKGFGIFEVIVVVVILGVVIAVGWYVYQGNLKANQTNTSTSQKATSKSSGNSLVTLSGTVTEGPTSPVAQYGNSGTAPVSNHTVEVEDTQGKVIASGKTDTQGKYVFHLSPGNYTLVLVPQIGMGALKNNSIQVISGVYTLDILADTGIR